MRSCYAWAFGPGAVHVCPQIVHSRSKEADKGKEPNQGTKQGTRQGNARNIASRQGTKGKDRGQRQGTRHPGKQQRRCRQATEDKGQTFCAYPSGRNRFPTFVRSLLTCAKQVPHIRGVPCFARVHTQHTDTCTRKIHPDTHTPTHPHSHLLTHSLTHTLTHSHTLSHAHAHAHTHTHRRLTERKL